ncbi:hypothetical protein SAMN04487925_101257 [Bradyrhizobium sp. cf659]|nr:hypothetical protein SAMN04487925_101257 [Bradyrhizobium sp. cf659]
MCEVLARTAIIRWGLAPFADVSIRAQTWSEAVRSSGAISDDGGPVVTTERTFVADHIRLRLTARVRHDKLRNRRRLRRHGAEAQHRAAAGGMPVARAVLIVVTIPGHRNVMRMYRRSGTFIVLVLMRMRGLIGRMRALNRCIQSGRERKRRGHRRKQISDGDKPSPPPSPWLSQANHLCTHCLDPEHIALVAGTANRKRHSRHRQCESDNEPRPLCGSSGLHIPIRPRDAA